MTVLGLVAARTAAGWPSRAGYAVRCGLSVPTCWRVEDDRAAGVNRSTLEAYGAPLGLDAETVEALRRGAASVSVTVVVKGGPDAAAG